MKWLFEKSRWIHKYIGLALILFLMWMSITGVVMNHPDLIAGVSVPGWLVPPQYPIKNWNRSAITRVIYSQKDPRVVFAAGKQGVWRSTDGGRTFEPFMEGLPESRYYRKTNHLFLKEGGSDILLAATQYGLYRRDLSGGEWRRVALSEEPGPVKKILVVRDTLWVLSESHLFVARDSAYTVFQQRALERPAEEHTVTLVRLFFDLHDGKVWGLPGKLLFDLTGIILFFLNISAFYSWYYPWKRRRNSQNTVRRSSSRLRRLFKWFLRYHLKLGIWTAAILFIMGATGMFMRPPLLAVLANKQIARAWYPGPLPANPWDKKIQNALYDAQEDRVIIAAVDGLWSAPASLKEPFRKLELDVPIFVMGATVFEPYGAGGYLVGSFNGLYHWERATGHSVDMLTGKVAREVSPVRPAEKMITAYITTPEGRRFINTHEQGILPLGEGERGALFQMPPQLLRDYRMPLWNYLFEIHNGRFFKDVIGKWYILLVPLGSLLFVLITLSGVYDWLYLNVLRKKPAAPRSRRHSKGITV